MLTTQEIISKMTEVVNHGSKDHRPQHYLGDLIWDGKTIADRGPQPFVWFVGDCGTHLVFDRSMYSAVMAIASHYSRFHFNGKDLKLLVGNECPLEA